MFDFSLRKARGGLFRIVARQPPTVAPRTALSENCPVSAKPGAFEIRIHRYSLTRGNKDYIWLRVSGCLQQ